MNAHAKIVQVLLQDKENRLCVDCQVNNSTHLSIIYGIFICESCALVHRTLPSPYNEVKSLDSPLSESELSYFTHGGNSNFLSFLSCYNIPSYSKIPFKYSTTAVHYYSKHLEALTLNIQCELSPPNMEDALKTFDEPESPNLISQFIGTIENSTKEVKKRTGEFFCDLHEGIKKKTRGSVETFEEIMQYGIDAKDKIMHTMESGKEVIITTAEKSKESVEQGGEYLISGINKGKLILQEGFEFIKSATLSPVNKINK